jgi:hypothetical protein
MFCAEQLQLHSLLGEKWQKELQRLQRHSAQQDFPKASEPVVDCLTPLPGSDLKQDKNNKKKNPGKHGWRITL